MNQKSAFTIAEVLIAMGIIGIVVTFGLKAGIQNDKGIRHIYSNTYHVLDTSSYNAMNFSGSANPFEASISAEEGARRLCRKLTEYINTVEPQTCQGGFVTDKAEDSEFKQANVQFTATNGVRFFLSKRLPGNGKPANGNPLFFLIFADINGTKFPNSMVYSAQSDRNHRNKSKDPDIFAFAVIDNGRVLPLGPPEFDGRFMLSRIAYYNIENSHNDEYTDVLYSKPSQPYYMMKAEAWGYYISGENVPDTFYIEDNPYTYNGYIKSKINSNSQIYRYVQNYFEGSSVKKITNARLRSAAVKDGGYNCVKQSDEECDIIIDKYIY